MPEIEEPVPVGFYRVDDRNFPFPWEPGCIGFLENEAVVIREIGHAFHQSMARVTTILGRYPGRDHYVPLDGLGTETGAEYIIRANRRWDVYPLPRRVGTMTEEQMQSIQGVWNFELWQQQLDSSIASYEMYRSDHQYDQHDAIRNMIAAYSLAPRRYRVSRLDSGTFVLDTP